MEEDIIFFLYYKEARNRNNFFLKIERKNLSSFIIFTVICYSILIFINMISISAVCGVFILSMIKCKVFFYQILAHPFFLCYGRYHSGESFLVLNGC